MSKIRTSSAGEMAAVPVAEGTPAVGLVPSRVPIPPFEKGDMKLSDGAVVPYLRVGDGPRRVVVVPGAGDGLRTVVDAARQLAWFYRTRARDVGMLFISRRLPLRAGFGVERHAEDYLEVMMRLGWTDVVLECNSAGGPIGQLVAARRPDLVRGLVLASTAHRFDSLVAQAVLRRWLAWLEAGRWGEFHWDSLVKTYRVGRRIGWARALLEPLLGRLAGPAHGEARIVNLLEDLLEVDHRGILPHVRCPTLVFGGSEDPILPADLQRDMASLLPDARLVLADGYLHGADLEAPAYAREFDRFVRRAFDGPRGGHS